MVYELPVTGRGIKGPVSIPPYVQSNTPPIFPCTHLSPALPRGYRQGEEGAPTQRSRGSKQEVAALAPHLGSYSHSNSTLLLTNGLRDRVHVQHEELHVGDRHNELGDGGRDASVDGCDGKLKLHPDQGILRALHTHDHV